MKSDDRACACECDSPAGQACTGATVTDWTSNDCDGAPLGSVAGDGACQPTAATTQGSLRIDAGTWVRARVPRVRVGAVE